MASRTGFFEQCFFFVYADDGDALAAFAGGLIAVFLNLFMALRFFSVKPEAGPEQVLRSLFRAEAMKWVWVVLLFGAAARLAPGHFMPLIVGFMVGLLAHWFALLWYPNGVRRG